MTTEALKSSHFRTFRFNGPTFILSACIMGSGAAGLVHEYILATVSTYILGSAIEQFSIIIALMMLSMGVAGWFQRFISDKNLVEKFLSIECVLAIVGAFAPLIIYGAYASMTEHFPLIQYAFVVLIGALIGFEIPLVLRVNQTYAQNLKVNMSNILSVDYIGAFIGAMAWTHYLLKSYPLTEIGFMVAGSNFLIAIIAFLFFSRRGLVKMPFLFAAIMLMICALLYFGHSQNRIWSNLLEQKFYDDPIVKSETTKYQRLVVTESSSTGDVRLYINGNVQFSSLDEYRYHEMIVHPAMTLHGNPKSVLILGGGDGLALKRVLSYPSVERVLLVDLDPDMIPFVNSVPELKKLHGDAFKDARVLTESIDAPEKETDWRAIYKYSSSGQQDRLADVMVMNIDADRFLDRADGVWDVVIIDFPDPTSIELVKLYSREFYKKLKRVLNDESVIVVQSTSPYHAKDAFLTIGLTLSESGFDVVPYRVNVPSFGEWGFHIARPGAGTYPSESVRNDIMAISELNVETEWLTVELMHSALVFGKGDLSSQGARINTLMEPFLLDIYRRSWLVN